MKSDEILTALMPNQEIAKSLYIRTTLDERIYALTGGAELIPITMLPRLLPIAYQSIKNQIAGGTFPLETILFNRKNCVRTADVARLIQNSIELNKSLRKKVGRPSNLLRANTIAVTKERT